jgi:TetR/AcrR family transcriptional repressor of mexJK operon
MTVQVETRQEWESPKRVAILDAATSLFVEQGYGAVSMDAIARAANVSKATLYAHFASKDALFATIINEVCRARMAPDEFLPGAALDPCAEIRPSLIALGRRLLGFLLEPRSLAIHRVVIAEGARFPELGRAFYENGPAKVSVALGAWLARQDAIGLLTISDPLMAAEHLVGLLKPGLYLRATLGIGDPPTQATVDATVEGAVSAFLRAYGRDCRPDR